MTQAMIQTSNPNHQVPTRRISFEESLRDLPRHFADDGDLIHSHLAAVLSGLFPDGEDFFVRSVRHYRGQITDPELKRQVSGFIGQEAMHGREHRMLNDKLAELGYPTKSIERFTKWGLETRERFLPPISNLALTAALEHFTATLAEMLLTNEDARRLFGHEPMRNLWLWHALEESEHKAVAFDVYRSAGGTERMRRWTMNAITVGFIATVSLMMIRSLITDRETYRRGRLRRSWRTFRNAPIMQRALWRQLRDYNRAGFHPDDHGSAELVEHWRSELFGDHGTLNDKLAGAGSAA